MAKDKIFNGIDREVQYGISLVVQDEKLAQYPDGYIKAYMARNLANFVSDHLILQEKKEADTTTFSQDLYILTHDEMLRVVSNIRNRDRDESLFVVQGLSGTIFKVTADREDAKKTAACTSSQEYQEWIDGKLMMTYNVIQET